MKQILYIFIFGLVLNSCGTAGGGNTSASGESDRKIENASFKNSSGEIEVAVKLNEDGILYYDVTHRGREILKASRLGLVREDSDFSEDLKIVQISEKGSVEDNYTLLHGKQKEISYSAEKYILHLKNGNGELMDIIFQLSDDGVAFRYYFPQRSTEVRKIVQEQTSYNFPREARGWLQPMSKAKTGWEHTNPSYEENYVENVPLTTKPAPGEGWVYPALFKSNEVWVLISETGLDRNYCGTRLVNSPTGEGLNIAFPQQEEIFPGGGLEPESTLPWYTPWRIIAIGDLKTITESTLGTDLAAPATIKDTQFIETGLASWSWALLKDESVNFDTTKEYIDYASQMEWEYCLIDVNWDTRIGNDGIKQLVDYAGEKGVKILVWYNSSGSWNNTPYTPKGKLLTRADREKEFAQLKELGVAGIKVDFFGGDGRSVIAYYHDLMADAARYELVLNFHGATLPRGWHRTYPHLLTVEAVKGHEFITFEQANADKAPSHATILPFSRNVFDPMDFTPMVLDTINDINRLSTPAFELALPVLFLSGIQHIAETPYGMAKQPDYVVDYLKEIPVQWDESRFIQGYPGKEVVLARRKGKTWHIVGINGENTEKSLRFDLDFIRSDSEGYIITDSADGFEKEELEKGGINTFNIKVQPYGGFVIKLE